jgi:hypothetical protein
MEVDIPEVLSELTERFHAYEHALTANDIEAVNSMFWADERTLRYGTRESENHLGHEAIAAFRRARGVIDQRRTLRNTRIATFGHDFGVAYTEYLPANSTRVGRQSQTWLRINGEWKIVRAHVSFGC